MMLNSIIKKYINDHKKDLFEKLVKARTGNEYKEENFRINYSIFLDELFKELDVDGQINIENEYSVFKGRIDSLYGNFIIEYKYPTRITRSSSPNNKKFVEQVQRHILGFGEKSGVPTNKVIGAVFDGYYIIYVKKEGEIWDESVPKEMTEDSHALFLMRLLSINSFGKALTMDNLIKDFGCTSRRSVDAISVLYQKLENNTKRNKAKLLYEQWEVLYREVCGYSFDTKDLKINMLKRQYRLQLDSINFTYLIFAIQTYFALLIKILSLNILTYLKESNFKEKYIFNVDDQHSLKNDFLEIEEGGKFRKLGITNFLEGDFFGWYLCLWDDEIYEMLQTLLETFEKYDYSVVILERDIARDLLKNLYYEMLPAVLRKNLGEFYTPDWLAEFLLNDLNPEIGKERTFLDPTCGSGTFIVLLIKKILKYYEGRIDSDELLKIIISSVRGYDLNPLAVICARANYIIALGDLLSDLAIPIEIPIYLSDAMLTVLEGYEKETESYIIPTKAETFIIPKKIADTSYINKVLDMVNDDVHRQVPEEMFIEHLKCNVPELIKMLPETEYSMLINFYVQMSELNEKGLDGIWTNVIKNSFAPVFQNKVDYIIGNPPWIDWQNLPENYRYSIQKYWYEYKVFDHKGQKAQLGSAHDDISVLMTYVIMDNYLKDKGKLAFVINQNLLQASGGGDGFRKFSIKEDIPVKVVSVHDFVEVQPFQALGVNNKTATIVLQKNMKNMYPVVYKRWYKREKQIIDANASIEDISRNKIRFETLFAEPIKEYNSSWMITTQKDRRIFEKMINDGSFFAYRARKGVDTSANAIFWVEEKRRINNNLIFINNTPENSRKNVSYVKNYPIESDMLKPLLRGKDVQKWKYDIKYSIILPYHCDGNVISTSELLTRYPNLYDYFFHKRHNFVPTLESRATYQKFIKRQNKNAPVYALYNIGEYTFSPYKVLWKALAKGVMAVTVSEDEKRMIVPDHNLLMIPLDDEDEAYYLSGILNADIVSRFVNSYVAWFISGHILERISIPKYCENNVLHKEIAVLSKYAHKIAGDKKKLSHAEKELNKKVNDLFLI